jgi:hypothetical protein
VKLEYVDLNCMVRHGVTESGESGSCIKAAFESYYGKVDCSAKAAGDLINEIAVEDVSPIAAMVAAAAAASPVPVSAATSVAAPLSFLALAAAAIAALFA